METVIIKAIQLMLSLSILVIVHEGGHFLFARLFKTRVEKFSLFFDPWFPPLFKFKPKNSETVYSVGWLPLGGYVKIAGMIDESMDKEQMKQPVQPWEFRAKPAWQRLLIMVAGILFNFLLALVIYSMILFAWGDSYIPVNKAPMGMEYNETAHNVGFEDGDVLVSADGKPLERLGSDLLMAVVDAKEVKVMRNGQETSISIPDGMINKLMKDSITFASFRIPFVVYDVTANSVAEMAGLQKGDSIYAMNGNAITYNDFFREMEKRRNASSSQHNILLSFMRNGISSDVELTTDDDFHIGVITNGSSTLPVVQKEYGFFEAFPAGITLGVNTLAGYVNQMKYIFSKEGMTQVGGFGTIANLFPAVWDWHAFWSMTALLSIMLAFMNILPIPALDGGHVLFTLYEIITRRKPNDKFLEYAEMVGIAILFALLVWANLNDVIRLLF